MQPANKEEREEIAKVIVDKPKIDLAIFFDYNSDVIGPKAVGAVNALGEALIIAGPQGLVIRAERAYRCRRKPRIQSRAVASARAIGAPISDPDLQDRAGPLLVAGFGYERLKLPDQPLRGENRRVEVVNASN